MMWKILTAQIREEIYNSLISCVLFPEEQKRSRKWIRGTGKLKYIDQLILKEGKTRRKILAITWIYNKKAYSLTKLDNRLSQKVQVIKFIENTIKKWRVKLTAGGKSLTEVKILRGIFQRDALSPLLFVIAMMPLNHMLRKCSGVYKLHELQEKNQPHKTQEKVNKKRICRFVDFTTA